MESVFNRKFDRCRSLQIRCPKCGGDPQCSVTRPKLWPVWFYCTSCKFSGDLLEAISRQTGFSREQAGAEVQKLAPAFDLVEFIAIHQDISDRTAAVNLQWEELKNSQQFDKASRGQFTKVPHISWEQYLVNEVVTQPITLHSIVIPGRRRLIFKVYDRPNLPCGLRSALSVGQAGKHLDQGVAFLAGGCQSVTSPVSDVILTHDALWAVQQHGLYWSQYHQPAPVMMPMGRKRILQDCFGPRVRSMVVWNRNQYRSICMAMEHNCRVSLLLSPPSLKGAANGLCRITDTAMPWPAALSQLVMETNYVGALLDAIPPLTEDHVSHMSIRARRKLRPAMESRKRGLCYVARGKYRKVKTHPATPVTS